MNIVGTGLSGLVGSRVVDLLQPRFHFTNFSLENGVDITNRELITKKIYEHADCKWLFHFAAFTDVQNAEQDKDLQEQSMAWKVNVSATQYILDAAQGLGMKIVYIDTDYAFDGKKQTYTEEDVPNPQSWYGITKQEGAKLVLQHEGLVLRIANPYRAHPVGKTDFVHKMIELLSSGKEILAVKNQLFVPTFIDDLAVSIEKLIGIQVTGVYHVVGSQPISPFDAAQAIAKTYGLDSSIIKPTRFEDYFASRAPVPQYAVLKSDKMQSLGISMHSFEEGIGEVKRQEAQ